MSIYSGKCDFFNHLNGQGGWFDKNGKPVKMGDPDVHVYYSDEMLDFLAFKKRTGGVIYQHKHLKVDEFNQEFIAKKCPQFKVIKHVNKVEDKRSKSGYKEKITYTYEYYGKEYTLKEINKKGIYITVDIHFNTLLDLIPYYPYIVSIAVSSGDKEKVYISNESFVESEYNEHLQHGWESNLNAYYREKLQNHYRDVVLRYFNPKGREVREELHFDEKRQAHTDFEIDPNFEVEWYFEGGKKSHWTSPKIIDNHTIEISEEDYKYYLGHTVKVFYVRYEEHPLYLE